MLARTLPGELDENFFETLVADIAERAKFSERTNRYERTPLHVAAYAKQHDAMRALVAMGADPNALEKDRYDIVTIAAVANDVPTLKVALEIGCSICPAMTAMKMAKRRHPCGVMAAGGGIRCATTT